MDSKGIEKVVRAVIDSLNNKMTLELARKIVKAVEEKAKEIGVIAVSNEGANPVMVECMDDSYIASYDIAVNKAYTSVALKMSTKKLSSLSQPNGELYGIQFTNEGKIVIFGGGVPLISNGRIIGGLGVSGGSEEQDTFLAEYGEKVFDEILKTR